MLNEGKTNNPQKKYNLEERTASFSENIIDFVKTLPREVKFNSIVIQLIRSSTSIGANYCEADDAESKKDFYHKIGICKKESRETMYWLRLIAKIFPNFTDTSRLLWKESQELNFIFGAIIKKRE